MRGRRILPVAGLTALLAALPAGASPPTLDEARALQAKALFDEAAGGYERFARASRRASEAPRALEEAIALRLVLGQVDAATEDLRVFLRTHAASLPVRAARARMAVVAYLVERGDPEVARRELVGWLSAYDHDAPLDARVCAHGWLGRLLLQRGEKDGGEAELQRVRSLWQGDAAARAVAALAAEPDGDRLRDTVLDVVGESLFLHAEKAVGDAEAILLPAYRGPSTPYDARKYVDGPVAAWAAKRRAATEKAERELREVMALTPLPAPRWVIASTSRIGTLWARFAASHRAPPVPHVGWPHGRDPGVDDLRDLYGRAFHDAAEPFRQRAKAAFQACLAASARLRHVDERSEIAIRWLARSYPAEYSAIDELYPRWGELGPAVPRVEPLLDPRTK